MEKEILTKLYLEYVDLEYVVYFASAVLVIFNKN